MFTKINKTRLILHKKISSQGLSSLNTLKTERTHSISNLRQKLLTLETNNYLTLNTNNNPSSNKTFFLIKVTFIFVRIQ